MFQDHFGGKALVALALGAGLAGCGGGGGGSTPGDSITTQLSPACTGASCGATDATSIREYFAHGGYKALEKALFDMSAADVVDEITRSGLRGRGGGAGAPWSGGASPSPEE